MEVTKIVQRHPHHHDEVKPHHLSVRMVLCQVSPSPQQVPLVRLQVVKLIQIVSLCIQVSNIENLPNVLIFNSHFPVCHVAPF